MNVLRRFTLSIVITAAAITTFAQGDAAIQKAFSESYSHEYNKRYTEAISVLSRLNNDRSYEINLRLGWLYYLNKNYQQSSNHYQKAVALKPYAVEAKLGLVKPLSLMESWDRVLQQYQEILKIDPQNTTANYWAGVIYYNRKKFEQASRLFEKVVNLYPFDYDATHMLGWTYLSMGRSNDAKVLFNKALVIRPGDASSLSGISKIR